MPTRLITPAVALAVSLASAKANLREETDAQDVIITSWILGITAHAEHYTGLSFINKTWRVTLDAFPDAIVLPPPVFSVTSVKYFDEAGVERTLDPADYLVDAVSQPGYVVPAYGKAWPNTRDQINSVTVDVVSGFGVSDESVPDTIKLYILAKLTEQFDPAVRMEKGTVQASYIDSLLDPVKVYG